MNSIFPIHEIGQKSAGQTPDLPTNISVPADSSTFSVHLASALIDLCRLAEPIQMIEQDSEVLLTFSSTGDPADIFNVRGATNTIGVPLGTGLGYGPLVNAYRAIKLPHVPTTKRLWLAGHGLGGAFALFLAVERLAERHNVAAVYTFGAPRAGDARFVRSITCPLFRIVNNLDLIPTLPAAWHWRHAGQHKLINADGSLNAHPNPLNRLPSLARQSYWLTQMLREGLASGYPRALFTLMNQVLGDHSPCAYQTRLRALSGLQ